MKPKVNWSLNWRVEKDSVKDIVCISFMRRRHLEQQNNLKEAEKRKKKRGYKIILLRLLTAMRAAYEQQEHT